MVEERNAAADKQQLPGGIEELGQMMQGQLMTLKASVDLCTGQNLGKFAQKKLQQTLEIRSELSGKAE